MAKGFVTLDNLVSAVLLGIGDEQNKRYEVKATQWVIDVIRRVHVSYSPYYKEERFLFSNEDIYSIDYPKDLVKILSVGLYTGAEFYPFTKKPDLSILTSGDDMDEFNSDAGEGTAVPSRGSGYGSQPTNTGYWTDDPQHCRVIVRMFGGSNSVEKTDWLKDKGVIIRYKSTGVDCAGNVCVPIEARDMIVQKVIYDFMRLVRDIPITNYNIELQRAEVQSLQNEYESLMYEPHTFWEVKDSIYSSLNTTARR
jgi:hypothetical protein